MTDEATRHQSLSPTAQKLGHLAYYSLCAVAMFVLVAPIVIVALISLNPTEQEAVPPTGLSFRWYEAFLNDPTFRQDFFLVSLPIAIVSAVLATVIGVAAAYALVRYELPYQNAIQAALTAPLMIPGVIVGFALLLSFAKTPIESGYVRIVLGHTVRILPYTVLTAMTSLYGLDPQLEQAARDLGASKYEAFTKITLPLMRSGVIAGFLLAFIISFADINVALFLTSANVTTVPVEMFLFLQWESSPLIAAVATVQLGLVLVLVVAIQQLVGFEAVFD